MSCTFMQLQRDQGDGSRGNDYDKPFEIDDLLATLKRVFEHADMSSEVSALRLELGKSAAEWSRSSAARSRCWRSSSSSGRSPDRTRPS